MQEWALDFRVAAAITMNVLKEAKLKNAKALKVSIQKRYYEKYSPCDAQSLDRPFSEVNYLDRFVSVESTAKYNRLVSMPEILLPLSLQ